MKKLPSIALISVMLSYGGAALSQTADAFMKNPAFMGAPPAQCVSTFEMQQCAAHDLRVADAEMGKRYAEVRTSLSPAAKQNLLSEQRTWLKLRDRDCIAKGNDGGSVASITVARCWVEITKKRSLSFDSILANKEKHKSVMTASAFLGRWRGGEGTVMKITRRGENLSIENQWGLDENMRGKFVGYITSDGMRFERNGVTETARPGVGDSVNLSALRGKKDCLIISQDEGYCRY